MAKTLKARLEDLENKRGDLPIMVFEQTWDNPDLFYLAKSHNGIMPKQSEIDKKDLLTRAQAEAMAGDTHDAIFIVYVKDWRGVDSD